MAETKIEWTTYTAPDGRVVKGYTFNPWIGCVEDTEDDGTMAPECRNCYAREGQNHRVSKARGLPLWGASAARQVTSAAYWKQPYAWDRKAQEDGVRPRVFCASLADVFEDYEGEMVTSHQPLYMDEVRAELWRLIEETPHLTWLLLTKRPENVYGMVPGHWIHTEGCAQRLYGGCGGACDVWPRNAWIGATAGTQRGADRRVAELVKIPAAVLFVSGEPLLEAVDFSRWLRCPRGGPDTCGNQGPTCCQCDGLRTSNRGIDWLIVGGESGPGARPFDLAWARSAVAQCRGAGVPCFVKQLGARPYARTEDVLGNGSYPDMNLCDRKGGDINEFPADLQVREWPEVRR